MSSSHDYPDTVPAPVTKTAGQVACDAWAVAHCGEEDPLVGSYDWSSLSDSDREEWEAAAAAVLRYAAGANP